MTIYNTPSFIRPSIDQLQTIAAIVRDSIPQPTSTHTEAAYAATQLWRSAPLTLSPYLRTQREGTAIGDLSFLNFLAGTFDDAACEQLLFIPEDTDLDQPRLEEFISIAFHLNDTDSKVPLHRVPHNLTNTALEVSTTYPDLKQGDNYLVRYVNEIAAFSSLYAAIIQVTGRSRDLDPSDPSLTEDLPLLACAWTEVFSSENVDRLSSIFFITAKLLGTAIGQSVAAFTNAGDNPLEDRNHIIWSLPGMVELEDIYHSSKPDLTYCKPILDRGLIPSSTSTPSTLH